MSEYWKYYHLTSDPFASENSEISSYVSARWQQLLDLLLHLSLTSNAILVVTGVLGVGKSTLLKQFIGHIKKEARVCEIKAALDVTPSVLLHTMAHHFGIYDENMGDRELKRAIDDVLRTMAYEGRHYILAVDNAHQLPEATHELILQFSNEHLDYMNPLHIILFGGPQLTAVLSHITADHIGEDLTHTQRIEPLTRQETAQYIEHRLACVGVPCSRVLTEKDIDEIYRQSGGVPVKINFFAKNTLVKYLPKKEGGWMKRLPSFRLIRQHWPVVIGSCVLMVLVAALMLMPRGTQELMNVAKRSGHAYQNDSLPPFSEKGEPTHPVDELSDNDLEVAPDAAPPALASREVPQASEKTETPLPPVETPKETMEAPLALSQSQELPKKQEEVVTRKQEAVIVKKQKVVATKKSAAPIHTVKPPMVASRQPIQKLKLSKKTNPVISKSSNAYTLQFLAAESKEKAEQFIKTHHLGSKAKVHYIRSQGKRWYIVVYGTYGNAALAQNATKELPKKLQQSHPWVRSIKSIETRRVG